MLKPTTLSRAALAIGLALPALPTWAADAAPVAAAQDPLPVILVAVALFCFALLLILMLLVMFQAGPLLRKIYQHPQVRDTFDGRALGLFVGDPVVFTGRAKDELLVSHDYDGIHEFDNDLPPWWKMTFYVTAIFAAVYLIWFHTGSTDRLSIAEYQAEMTEATLLAQKAGLADDPNKPTDYKPLTAAADLIVGKTLFGQNCAACHGKAGEGQVGPNLTDEYWLHGGEVNKIFHTIKYGVQGKGMVPWKGKLSGKEMLQVASYILTLKGTNPPNAKEPQGEKEGNTATTAGAPGPASQP